MLRKTTLTLVAVVILLSCIPALATIKLPDVVAVVNGEKITKDELISMLIDWQSPIVLEEMINYRIVGQEARKAGVIVTADQVKARMEEIKKTLPPGESFEDMLKRSGLTPEHAFAVLKMQMQTEEVLKKQISVTDKDLEGYRKASHILIRIPFSQKPEEAEAKDKEAKEKIEKIAAEIKGGLAFEEAAKKYSEDYSNKDKGGDLGFFPQGQMAPEFEKKTFEMKVGEVSEPVKTNFGYHLIKLNAIGNQTTGEERKKLEEMITRNKMGEKYRDWMLTIKNKAQVENKLEPPKPKPAPAPKVETPSTAPAETPPPPPPAPSEEKAPSTSESTAPAQSAPATPPAQATPPAPAK